MRSRLLLLVCCLLLTLFAASACRTPAPPNALSPLDEPLPQIRLNGQLAMFTLVRQALALYPDMRRILELPKDPDLPPICDRPIIVSIYAETGPPLWGVGAQGCMHKSLLRAVYQITQDPNFKKYYLLNLDKVAVRLDVVTNRQRLDLSKKNISKVSVEPGVHGLLLQNGDEMVYQPPFAFMIYSWEREWDGKQRTARLKAQLRYLAKAADIGKNDWDEYPIYRFRTTALLQHRPDFIPLPLYRDAPFIRRFSSREVGRAAVDAGRYLNKTFSGPTQRFRYEFNPITVRKSNYFSYNTVSHAGTVYALLRLYQASRKAEFYPLVQAATEFLMRNTKPPLLEPDLLCVERNYVAQLGATALTLMALCELPKDMLERIGTDRVNRLARFLVEMQEDNGRFYDYYWQRLVDYLPKRSEPMFAGEAFLALVRYYRVNPNVEWLAAARLAAQRQIADFARTNEPDYWTVQALAELYEQDPDPRFATTCFAMADRYLRQQWGNPLMARKTPYADYQGGFDTNTPPRTVAAASRIQALLAAHKLAFRVNRDPKPYAEAILSATRFLMQNQYRRDNAYYVHMQDEVRGGFRGSLIDPTIRIDYCQHAILALTGAYDIAYMRETGQVPTELQSEGTRELQDDLEPQLPSAETPMPEPTPEMGSPTPTPKPTISVSQ